MAGGRWADRPPTAHDVTDAQAEEVASEKGIDLHGANPDDP